MKLALRCSFRVSPKVVLTLVCLLVSAASVASALILVQARAEKVRIDAVPPNPGPLYVRIGSEEKRIADAAVGAWLVDDGRYVTYSGIDGAGGYENEGQSLRVYDPAAGSITKVLSEYYTVDRVTGVRTTNKRLALIVEMRDNGLGASHVAVVDPLRGEVFSKSKVKLMERSSDSMVLGYFREKDWQTLNKGANIRPYKTERFNLNSLLERSVITNKRRPL